jgi:LssY C-terminus
MDLQSGDTVEVSASSVPDSLTPQGVPVCDPKGDGSNVAQPTDLPLPSAPTGALIARLHGQGSTPVLLSASGTLRMDEPSHLFLGINVGATPPCHGNFAVKVRKVSGPSAAKSGSSIFSSLTKALESESGTSSSQTPATATGSTDTSEKSRGQELKSQLGTAAQVFMAGQFGEGGSGSNAATSTSAPVLKVSSATLDGDLRKGIDSFPRRVNDQFKNLGDMVNFVIVGNEKDVQAALDAANWHVADTSDEKAVLSAVMETYEKKDYLQMPMSTLYLFGRRQDFGYEQAEPIAMVASRHHFRIWKTAFTWKGSEVWVGAGTHDIGFAKDQRNGSVTHKIDPAVDGERDNIGSSLQKSGKAKTLTYYLPANPVQDAKNATGDGYHSDGRLLVILLQ